MIWSFGLHQCYSAQLATPTSGGLEGGDAGIESVNLDLGCVQVDADGVDVVLPVGGVRCREHGIDLDRRVAHKVLCHHDPVVYGHILDREGVRDVIEHEALGCKVGWNLALQDVRDGLMGGAVVRAPHEPDVQGGVPDPQALPDELPVLLVLVCERRMSGYIVTFHSAGCI